VKDKLEKTVKNMLFVKAYKLSPREIPAVAGWIAPGRVP
jgi:hypothetical protein